MSDSLVYAGIQLLGGGVTQPAGWMARLGVGGLDLGSPEPDTAVVASLLLDGERITGDASSDRTITLAVTVLGATRQIVSRGIAALQKAANARSSTLTWTPDSGSTVVFDTWRGRSAVTWNLKQQRKLSATVMLDLTALPYSRNPLRTTVTVGASAVQFDSCDSLTPTPTGSLTVAGSGALSSNAWALGTGIEGTHALALQPNATASWNLSTGATAAASVDVSRQGLTARDFSAAASIQPAFNWRMDPALIGTGLDATFTPGTATLVLTDNTGHTATLTTPAPAGDNVWRRLAFATPSVWPALFDAVHVTGWHLTVTGTYTGGSRGISSGTANWYVGADDAEIYPRVSSGVAVANGGTYRFPAIAGTARCPVAIQATRTGGISSLVVHKAPAEARADYTPLVPYGSVGVALAASAAMPAYLGSTAGARYNGTHAVILGGVVLGGSGNRTVSVTFTETYGDPVAGGSATSTVSRVCQPSDVLNGLLDIGILTLPARAVVDDNTATSMTVTVTDSLSGATSVQDVLVLDLRGPTVRVGNAFARDTVWVDEPSVDTGIGAVLIGSTIGGGANGRASAVGCWDSTTIDPGPLSFEPGDNLLLAYCPQGAVILSATYAERYMAEAV